MHNFPSLEDLTSFDPGSIYHHQSLLGIFIVNGVRGGYSQILTDINRYWMTSQVSIWPWKRRYPSIELEAVRKIQILHEGIFNKPSSFFDINQTSTPTLSKEAIYRELVFQRQQDSQFLDPHLKAFCHFLNKSHHAILEAPLSNELSNGSAGLLLAWLCHQINQSSRNYQDKRFSNTLEKNITFLIAILEHSTLFSNKAQIVSKIRSIIYCSICYLQTLSKRIESLNQYTTQNTTLNQLQFTLKDYLCEAADTIYLLLSDEDIIKNSYKIALFKGVPNSYYFFGEALNDFFSQIISRVHTNSLFYHHIQNHYSAIDTIQSSSVPRLHTLYKLPQATPLLQEITMWVNYLQQTVFPIYDLICALQQLLPLKGDFFLQQEFISNFIERSQQVIQQLNHFNVVLEASSRNLAKNLLLSPISTKCKTWEQENFKFSIQPMQDLKQNLQQYEKQLNRFSNYCQQLPNQIENLLPLLQNKPMLALLEQLGCQILPCQINYSSTESDNLQAIYPKESDLASLSSNKSQNSTPKSSDSNNPHHISVSTLLNEADPPELSIENKTIKYKKSFLSKVNPFRKKRSKKTNSFSGGDTGFFKSLKHLDIAPSAEFFSDINIQPSYVY